VPKSLLGSVLHARAGQVAERYAGRVCICGIGVCNEPSESIPSRDLAKYYEDPARAPPTTKGCAQKIECRVQSANGVQSVPPAPPKVALVEKTTNNNKHIEFECHSLGIFFESET